VNNDVLAIFSEEVVRSGAAAPLSQVRRLLHLQSRAFASSWLAVCTPLTCCVPSSTAQLLRVLDPRLRELAHMGDWQVISPHVAAGTVVYVPRLADVCNTVYAQPTVIVAGHVSGEEDIAAGAVAVLTPDAPDGACLRLMCTCIRRLHILTRRRAAWRAQC
jgi:hypothetical protein